MSAYTNSKYMSIFMLMENAHMLDINKETSTNNVIMQDFFVTFMHYNGIMVFLSSTSCPIDTMYLKGTI